MKKIIALFLILAVSAASLSGCKGGETTEAPTSASETTKAPDESGTPAPSTTAADETTAPAPAFEADYSKYLDDYG